MRVTLVGYSWKIQEIFLHSIFSEHSPGNIRIFNIPGTFLREYSPEFHRERFLNIPGIHHRNAPRIFHKLIFARWDISWAPKHILSTNKFTSSNIASSLISFGKELPS